MVHNLEKDISTIQRINIGFKSRIKDNKNLVWSKNKNISRCKRTNIKKEVRRD